MPDIIGSLKDNKILYTAMLIVITPIIIAAIGIVTKFIFSIGQYYGTYLRSTYNNTVCVNK